MHIKWRFYMRYERLRSIKTFSQASLNAFYMFSVMYNYNCLLCTTNLFANLAGFFVILPVEKLRGGRKQQIHLLSLVRSSVVLPNEKPCGWEKPVNLFAVLRRVPLFARKTAWREELQKLWSFKSLNFFKFLKYL